MNDIDDPARQLSLLKQILSSDKKPLGIFLGAGCPAAIRSTDDGAALIPDVSGITNIVRAKLAESSDYCRLLRKLDDHFTMDGHINPTVEDILTHVRSLRIVAGNDEVRGLSAESLDLLDDQICQLIHVVTNQALPNAETAYHRLAAWVGGSRRSDPVEIFTTNYDMLMEQAFEAVRIPYFDGFSGVQRPFFDLRGMEEDSLPARWARLWKLHGSINWYQTPEQAVFRSTADGHSASKRVIHPSHLKYQESRRLPYLAMFDRLRAFLKQPTAAMVICGYSFRDFHVNEVIVQGLEATPSAVAFALIKSGLARYPHAIELARKRPNLNLLGRDGAVIGGPRP